MPEIHARISGYGEHAGIQEANHSDMCKFTDASKEGYKQVMMAIKKVSQSKEERKNVKVSMSSYRS